MLQQLLIPDKVFNWFIILIKALNWANFQLWQIGLMEDLSHFFFNIMKVKYLIKDSSSCQCRIFNELGIGIQANAKCMHYSLIIQILLFDQINYFLAI